MCNLTGRESFRCATGQRLSRPVVHATGQGLSRLVVQPGKVLSGCATGCYTVSRLRIGTPRFATGCPVAQLGRLGIGTERIRIQELTDRTQKAPQILLSGYCVATPIGYFYKMAQVKTMHDKPACVQT